MSFGVAWILVAVSLVQAAAQSPTTQQASSDPLNTIPPTLPEVSTDLPCEGETLVDHEDLYTKEEMGVAPDFETSWTTMSANPTPPAGGTNPPTSQYPDDVIQSPFPVSNLQLVSVGFPANDTGQARLKNLGDFSAVVTLVVAFTEPGGPSFNLAPGIFCISSWSARNVKFSTQDVPPGSYDVTALAETTELLLAPAGMPDEQVVSDNEILLHHTVQREILPFPETYFFADVAGTPLLRQLTQSEIVSYSDGSFGFSFQAGQTPSAAYVYLPWLDASRHTYGSPTPFSLEYVSLERAPGAAGDYVKFTDGGVLSGTTKAMEVIWLGYSSLFTMGHPDKVRLTERPMKVRFEELPGVHHDRDEGGHARVVGGNALAIDFDDPASTAGQPVLLSRSWLRTLQLPAPRFQYQDGTTIPYAADSEFYSVFPPHFSLILGKPQLRTDDNEFNQWYKVDFPDDTAKKSIDVPPHLLAEATSADFYMLSSATDCASSNPTQTSHVLTLNGNVLAYFNPCAWPLADTPQWRKVNLPLPNLLGGVNVFELIDQSEWTVSNVKTYIDNSVDSGKSTAKYYANWAQGSAKRVVGELMWILTLQTSNGGNTPPKPAFVPTATYSPSTQRVTYTVDASGSEDAETPAALLQVKWDWEADGLYDTSYSGEKTATHEYFGDAKPKCIRLSVKDVEGLEAQVQGCFYKEHFHTGSHINELLFRLEEPPPSANLAIYYEADRIDSYEIAWIPGFLEPAIQWATNAYGSAYAYPIVLLAHKAPLKEP